MPLHEVITEWSGVGKSPKLSIMYWNTTTTLTDARAGTDSLWVALAGYISGELTWNIRTEARTLDEASGTLTGLQVDTTSRTGVGGSPNPPLADATQALIRWRTGLIVNGRFLQGRQFIPGVGTGNAVGGNVRAAMLTAWNDALTTFVTGAADFGVWHRPVAGAGGQFAQAVSGNVWEEFAVQRRRRG